MKINNVTETGTYRTVVTSAFRDGANVILCMVKQMYCKLLLNKLLVLFIV